MSFPTEYDSLWNEMYDKRLALFNKRASLEAELSDVKTQIAHLNEIMGHLGPLAGIPANKDIASLGITDAVRWVLSNSAGRISANEVRDKLAEKGYDFSSLSAPMASIYKILSRLASENNGQEISREKDPDGKVYYQWIHTEQEIPF
jgi:hypothetical protein